MDLNHVDQPGTSPDDAPQDSQRNLGSMLLNDAHTVIVNGVEVALGIGISRVLDRRNRPATKPPKEGGRE